MGFNPADIQQVGVAIAAFLLTITTVFLFMTAWQERVARALGITLASLVVWGWASFASYLFAHDLGLSREMRVLASLAGAVSLALTARIGAVYLTGLRPLKEWERDLVWLVYLAATICVIFFTADLFGTHFMMGEFTRPPLGGPITLHAGPMFIFYAFSYLFTVAVFSLLMGARALREQKGGSRRAGLILGGSIALAYLMVSTGFLPWYGIDNAALLLPRALAVPMFVVAAFYSITNYRLFNLDVAAAEVFVFGMWAFVFLRTLLHPTLAAAIPDIALLLAVIVIGLLFIRNITTELATRLELQTLSEELRVLNTDLDKKVNERTREVALAREHVEELVEHLPVGLIEVQGDGTIIRVNESAETLLGVTREKLTDSALDTHPELAAFLPHPLAPGTYEGQVHGARQRDMELAIAELSLETGRGYAIIMRDVTERRALERAKNDFIETAAHQLRTPLAAMKWVFNLLSEGDLTEDQKAVVSQGTLGVENMERIAEGLMMTARTAPGAEEYSFVKAPLSPVLSAAAALLAPLAKKKHVAFETDIPEDLPVFSFDAEHLRFAIQNLLDNAIKYTPEGGSVRFSAHATPEQVEIRLSDTGIGISEEDQKRLFERFFRAEEAVRMFANGSGLGLSIVKGIIDAHRGTIAVSSKIGAGTTFIITLPTSPVASA